VRVYVLGSGSSGNGILLDAGGTRIIVDAGIGPRKTARRLETLGLRSVPRIDAIVVTHQHGDHIERVESLAREFLAPIYFHRGIEARRVRARFDVRAYTPRVPFAIGAFEIHALPVPHDAPQVALRFSATERTFGLATDLGRVPAELVPFLADCDVALVEANYCPELLATGPYPLHLRKRVSGGLGHLANEQTADLAEKLSTLPRARIHRLLLGHISRSNNTPERALSVVRARTRPRLQVEVVEHGVPAAFVVRGTRPAQLSLPLSGAFSPASPSR
jgi:phosphoribosyl 1,2-cyclic phosphodiesterase